MDDDSAGHGTYLTVPVFPLPNVVLFPKTFLPLHIFEMRYRAMVGDALACDKLIAMTLLKDGWETSQESEPPVFQIACVGKIKQSEKLEIGRYNLLLYGLYKVRLLTIQPSAPYRSAEVEVLRDIAPVPDHEKQHRESLMQLARKLMPGRVSSLIEDISLLDEMDYESLVNTLAMAASLPMHRKQELLELESIDRRAEFLITFMEQLADIREFFQTLPYITPNDPHDN
jgi:uncharacterized protein